MEEYMKALWELLLKSVSTPLRRTLVVALGVLSVQVEITKTLLQMEYRDVMLGSYFLTTSTLTALVLAVEFLKHAKNTWSFIVSSALFLAAIGIGILAWRQWHYTYEEGVYSERHWEKVSRAGDGAILSWNLKAAKAQASTVTVEIEINEDACKHAQIENLHPINLTNVLLDGAETGNQTPSSRQFTFKGFRRPAELQFQLRLAGLGSSTDPESCLVTRTPR